MTASDKQNHILRSCVFLAAIGLAVCLSATASPVAAKSRLTCMDGHWHDAAGAHETTKKRAMASALQYWFDYTAGEYGSDWANWKRATDRSEKCIKVDGGKWQCFIAARPCRKS